MPKRSREDEASEELIAKIQDDDILESALENFKSEKASLQKVFEDAKADILKKYKTDDPETLSEREQIRFNTEVEYEQGLLNDRLFVLDDKMAEYKKNHQHECATRKRRRVIKRQIDECADIAQQDASTCHWKLIGKVKHVQMTLNEKVTDMTPEQVQTYTSVLKELKQKGWRVLKCTYLNSEHSTDGPSKTSE